MKKENPIPRIFIDGRMVGEISHGISRYVRMIAKGLAERSSLPYEPVFFSAPGMSAAFSGFETVEIRTPFLDPTEMVTLPIALWKRRATLYHSPSFSSLPAAPCPWIITIHDLNHLIYGGTMERAYYETVLRSFAERAKAVLTVSEFAKQEIQRWNRKLNPEIVLNAIDPQFLKEGGSIGDVLGRYGLVEKKYFVCLAGNKSHKNLSTLVHAFRSFRENSVMAREFRLVLSVKDFEGEPGVVSGKGLSDSDAHALVRGSCALASPSVYEGFGLPPVEAGILGVSLLVSDIPAHREALRTLASDEMIWVKPLAENEWSAALQRAANGGVKPLSRESREILRMRFSVDEIGTAMDRVYRRVLGLSV